VQFNFTLDRIRKELGARRRVTLCVSSVLTSCLLSACVPDVPLRAQHTDTSLHGTVTDREGSVCEGAQVTLDLGSGSESVSRTVASDEQGRYDFGNLPPGHYKLTVSARGFATNTLTGELPAGESRELPAVVLMVTSSAEVTVSANLHEIAEAQLNLEEKQRVLGFLPNYYVTYAKNPVPLTPGQKFRLALHNEIDPMTFVFTGIWAGVGQSENSPAAWGQGASGYGKRYAALYANDSIDTFVSGAVLASAFHQDPRYYYKGTGTVTGRIFYALSSAVICHGDNGKRQLDYSGLVGDTASAEIANLYYPKANRDGIELILQNLGIGKATEAAQNVLQEFVVRHFTPKVPKDPSPQQ
jgi:hypothetical protein